MSYTNGLDDPTLYFNTVLWTGDASSNRAITGVGFQPDWLWIKDRDATENHCLFDSVRGADKRLFSNSTSAEDTLNSSNRLVSFDTDGFTIGLDGNVNGSGDKYVGWSWLGGGTASSNTDGSITSSVSASTTAGFSIVSYTGTGSSATVGHGLGAVPKMFMVKRRDSSGSWQVYHGTQGATKFLVLNQTGGVQTASSRWNDTEPTSSVFTVNTDPDVNGSSATYIAYCFAEKKGYSKFGSYEGNGNNDGTFVYTGFKPAWVVTKSIDTTSHWNCKDNKRSTFNTVDDYHKLNEATAEDTGVSSHAMDFLSNGFKHRGNNDEVNGSETYIYMAFAESPFVTSTGIPTTAR